MSEANDLWTVRLYGKRGLSLVLLFRTEAKAKDAYERLTDSGSAAPVACEDDYGNCLTVKPDELSGALMSGVNDANRMQTELEYRQLCARMHLQKKIDDNPQLKAAMGRSNIVPGPRGMQ